MGGNAKSLPSRRASGSLLLLMKCRKSRNRELRTLDTVSFSVRRLLVRARTAHSAASGPVTDVSRNSTSEDIDGPRRKEGEHRQGDDEEGPIREALRVSGSRTLAPATNASELAMKPLHGAHPSAHVTEESVVRIMCAA